MTGDTANLLLADISRFHATRLMDDVRDLKVCMSSGEESVAGTHRRLDRVELHLDRIETRLDLVELPH